MNKIYNENNVKEFNTNCVLPIFEKVKKGNYTYFYLKNFVAFKVEKVGHRLRYLNRHFEDCTRNTFLGSLRVLTGNKRGTIYHNVKLKSYDIYHNEMDPLADFYYSFVSLQIGKQKEILDGYKFDGEKFHVTGTFGGCIDECTDITFLKDLCSKEYNLSSTASIQDLEEIQNNWNKKVSELLNIKEENLKSPFDIEFEL